MTELKFVLEAETKSALKKITSIEENLANTVKIKSIIKLN